jgi:hypothetical protein
MATLDTDNSLQLVDRTNTRSLYALHISLYTNDILIMRGMQTVQCFTIIIYSRRLKQFLLVGICILAGKRIHVDFPCDCHSTKLPNSPSVGCPKKGAADVISHPMLLICTLNNNKLHGVESFLGSYQLLKSLPTFYLTRKFVTVLTRARHWPLS